MKSLLFGNRRTLSLGGLIGTAALAVPSLWGESIVPTEVEMLDGIGWLASEANGAIVRINGETGKVDAKVGFEESQGILDVNQNGSSVLVTVGGQVHSIDVAALDWGKTTGASDQLVVGDGVAFMLSADGAVRVLDAVTLDTLGEVALGEPVAGPATSVGKRLIVPLTDGTVAVVTGDDKAIVDVGDDGDQIHVTAVGRTVVVLNVSAGEVFRLDAKRAKLRGPVDVDVPAGDLIVPPRLSAGRLWLLAPDTGDLLGVAPSTGKVVTAHVADPGHDLVGPVVDAGNVYLVDRSAKAIVQVPVKTLKPTSHALAVDDASRIELKAEGGKVFVNDPTSAVAVVIDGDTYRDVDKYDDDDAATSTPTNSKTPPPPRPAPTGPPAGPPKVPPAPPRNVTAQAGSESATVSWAPGGGGGVATSFFVTYEDGDTVEVPGNRLSVPIDDLENGEEYVFEVWAENQFGESEPVASNAVVPNDRVPGTPASVQATSGDASARVTWAAADDRGREITEYIVTSAPDGITARVPGNATEATVGSLTNGTNYTFTVTAVNDLDVQGEPSAPSPGVMPYGVPGPPTLVAAPPSDGSLTIDWQASANLSEQPVEYAITVDPADAAPAPTQATEVTLDGLTNGMDYRVTITPSNDRGAGTPLVVEGRPGRAPSGTMSVSRTGDLTFDVTLDVDDGGRPITGCTISWNGGSDPCDGAGTYSVTVATYNTGYNFSASVTNAFGDGPGGTDTDRSNTKPYTIRSDGGAFDGTCTWDAGAGGRPNTRPYFRNARHTCPQWDPVADRPVGYLALGSGVRGECHTQGGSIKDDNLVSTTTWIRLTNGYYMPTIYFTNYQSGPTDGLPAC